MVGNNSANLVKATGIEYSRVCNRRRAGNKRRACRFGKKNKRRALNKRKAWKIWKKKKNVGQEKFDKKNKCKALNTHVLCSKETSK